MGERVYAWTNGGLSRTHVRSGACAGDWVSTTQECVRERVGAFQTRCECERVHLCVRVFGLTVVGRRVVHRILAEWQPWFHSVLM